MAAKDPTSRMNATHMPRKLAYHPKSTWIFPLIDLVFGLVYIYILYDYICSI